MTRWDSSHERYFTSLATLSFDKAKELLEKDGSRMHPEFLQLFQQLLQYERSYHNFGFVPGPKGNLSSVRKERTLCECYSDLHMSLIHGQPAMKASPSIQSTIDESKESIGVSQLISGLTSFFQVRTSLMKLYEQISSAVKRNERNVRLELFLDETLVISQINMSPLNISVLTPIHQLLKHEIDCLLLLIQSYVSICDYKYMEAISTLHHMHGVLKEWHDNIENQQNANLRFTLTGTSALNFFKSPTKPALYTFYSKFHELLVAKFSLYFSQKLYEYGGADAKATIGKTNPDFAARIAQFYRRSNVEWIGLILHTFNAKSQSDPSAPNMNSASSTGASDDWTFQIIFSYPATLTASDEIAQAVNCKALINRETLITGEKVFYHGDVSQSKTYFLQNIDPRFTLVLVFASHRQERDTTIVNFLGELIDLLRGSRQLLSFKNAPK